LRNQNIAISGGYVQEAAARSTSARWAASAPSSRSASIIIDPVRACGSATSPTSSFRMPRREWVYRVDRQPSIGIQVTRDSTGNIERISREVRATLVELQADAAARGRALRDLLRPGQGGARVHRAPPDAGLWGGFFAALVIYVFLRAPRMTAILTLSIPLSLLCTIVALFFMGWSLNMATMMGLLLAVGMVVDNAIVIVENIYRHRQEGRRGHRASIVGAGEVGLAVVMSTLTTIVVFLPLILMGKGGEFSFWMLRIGVPVIASLLASLFIALVFVPLAAQRLSRGRHHRGSPRRRLAARPLRRALGWVLTHRIEPSSSCCSPRCGTPLQQRAAQNPAAAAWAAAVKPPMHLLLRPAQREHPRAGRRVLRQVEDFLAANAARYGVERIETRFRNNNGRIQLKLAADNPTTQWYASAWESFS
jgi:hypothetical protein